MHGYYIQYCTVLQAASAIPEQHHWELAGRLMAIGIVRKTGISERDWTDLAILKVKG